MSVLPSGSDLEYAVRRLRLAAVDAFMCGPVGASSRSGGFDKYGPRGVAENGYYGNPLVGIPELRGYTRPRQGGVGGGDGVDENVQYSSFSADGYVGDFNEVYEWIDEIVDRWRDVPDPEGIAHWQEAFKPVVDCFGHGFVDSDGRPRPPEGGTLWNNLEDGWFRLFGTDVNKNGVLDDGEGLRGGAFRVFKDFYQQLFDAVYACDALVSFVDASLGAEKAVWVNARKAAAQTVHRVAGVCEQLAETEARGIEIGTADILNGGSMLLGLASLVPGPHQVPAGVASLGLSVVVAAAPSDTGTGSFSAFEYVDPPRPAIPSYSGAIEVLSLLLNGSEGSVDETVTRAEQSICDTVGDAIRAITDTHHTLFNPRPGPVTEPPRTLRHDRERALDIVDSTARVADALCTVAGQVQSCREAATGGLLSRHERIGSGPRGPYDRLDGLMFYLGLVLKELGEEAAAAAVNLRAVVDALDQAEVDRQALIQTTVRRFEAADSGYVSHYYNTLADDPPAVPAPVIPNLTELMSKEQ